MLFAFSTTYPDMGIFEPVWPDLKNFYHFGKIFDIIGKLLRVYLVFVKIYAIRQIFFVVNGQILKNGAAIWPHWFELRLSEWLLTVIQFNQGEVAQLVDGDKGSFRPKMQAFGFMETKTLCSSCMATFHHRYIFDYLFGRSGCSSPSTKELKCLLTRFCWSFQHE